MCWIGLKSDKHKAKVPIKTFKICYLNNEKEIRSLHYSKEYKIGKKYRKLFLIGHKGKYRKDRRIINEGFHSYSCSKLSPHRGRLSTKVMIKDTLHVFETYFNNICKGRMVIVNCTIPKGATYYENNLGEIVSNRIIIDGCL